MSTGGVVLSPLAASQQQQQPEPFATSLPLNDVRVGANDWYNVTASIRNAIVAFAEHFGYHARRLERVETTLTDNSKDVDRRLRRIEERVELAASDKSTLGTDGAHRLAAMEERLAFVTEAISQKQAESVRLAMLEERVSRALEVAETASAFASSASTKAEGSRVAALEEVVAVLRERVSHAPIATAPPPTPATPVRVVSDVASHVATLDAADSAMREAQMANARCEQLEEARRREANRLATLSTSVAEMVARVDAADLPSLRADMDAIGANAERAIATAETQLKKAKSSHGSGANPTDIARLGSRVSELEGAQQTQQEELTRRMDDLEPAAAEAIASASRALKANKALESKHSKLVARCESISRELEQTVSRCEAVEQSANDLLGRLSAVESASSSAHEGARGSAQRVQQAEASITKFADRLERIDDRLDQSLSELEGKSVSAQRVQQAEASITKFADRLERIDDRLDQSLSELEGKSVSLADEVKKCAVASRAASERSSEALSRSESVAAMAGSASALSAIDGRLRELEKKEQREGGNSEAVQLRVKVLEAQMKQAASASSVESLRDYIHEVNIELHGEEFRSSILQKVQPLVSVSDLRQDEEITKMRNELSRVNSKVAQMGGGLHDVSARQEAVVSQLGDQVANLQLQLGKIAAGTESDARQDAAVLKLSHTVSALQAQLGQIADGTAEDERQNATMAQMKQSIAAMQSQLSQASTSSEDARQDAAMAKLSQTVAAMQSQISQAGASTEDARQDATMTQMKQSIAAMQSQLSQASTSSEDARQDAAMAKLSQTVTAMQSQLSQASTSTENARQDAAMAKLSQTVAAMQSQLSQASTSSEDARQDAAMAKLSQTVAAMQSQLSQAGASTEDARQDAAMARQDATMAKLGQTVAAMQSQLSQAGASTEDARQDAAMARQDAAMAKLGQTVAAMQSQLSQASTSSEDAQQDAAMAKLSQTVAAMQSQLSQAGASTEDARQDAAMARQDATMAKLGQTVAAMQSQLSQASTSSEDARQDAAMAKLSQTVAAMQSQLSQAGASSEDARQDATMTQMKQSLAALQSELRQIPSYSETDARQDANIQQLGNAMSLMQSQLGQMASGTETDARQDAAVQQLGRTISGLQSQLAQLNEGTAEDVRQNAAIAKLMQKVHSSSHAQDATMAKVNSKFAAMQWKQTIKDSKLRSELEKQNVSGAIPELRAAVESIQAQLQTISHPKSTAEREDTHESLRRAELRILALEKQNASLEENLNSLTRSAASAAALGTVERRVTILEQENGTRLLGDTTNSQTIQHLEGRVAEIEVKSGILSPDVENRLAEAGRLSETIPALTRRIVECEALKTRISEFERRAASAAALEDLSMRIDHIAQNTASHDSQSQADLRARLAEREVSASAARAADEAAIVELKVRVAGAEAAANASAARAAEASAVSLRSQEIGEQVRLELSASTAYSEQRVAGMLQDVDTLKTVIFGKKSAAVTANFTPSQILQGGPLASLLAASEAAVAHPPGSLAPEPSFSADPNVHAIASMGTPGTEGRHGSRSVIKDVDSLVTQVSELQVLLAESSTDLASMQASVSSTSGDVRHLMSDTYRRVEAHAAAIGTLGKSISRGMETRPTLEKVNAIVDSKLDDRMERVQRRIKSLEGEYDDVRGRILRIGRAFETATSEIEQRLLVMASRQGPSRSSPGSPAAFGRVIQGAVNESRMAREAPTHRQAQPRSPIAESPISQSRKQLSFSEDVSESSFARAGESELRKIKESVRRANTEIQEAEKSLDETVESLAEGVDDGDTTK
ncbi:hypothetical protein NFJ02_33g83350 [Pycnococcus provasolii]